MDTEDTKALALDALAAFRDEALCDPATYARGAGGPAQVDAAVERIRACMEPSASPNPDYAPMPEAAAVLAVLALAQAEGYAALLGEVATCYARKTTHPGTLQGLLLMDDFLSAIGDDHEWSLDEAGPDPVVRYLGDAAPGPTLTPRSLRDAVRRLLDGPASAPAP